MTVHQRRLITQLNRFREVERLLSESVAKLEDRLTSVLRLRAEAPDDKSPPCEMMVPLADQIRSFNDATEKEAYRIVSICERLELPYS